MKTISLNIMMTYPVRWRKQQVLRDIAQNFYDDAGLSEFGEKFKTDFNPVEREITLSMPSEGFSYEWLMHMGASTKQGETGKFAGFFGEGFKVASLCALRDHGWTIRMRSRDWSLEVVALDMDIDGKPLQQLAYQLADGLEPSLETTLIIGNASEEDAKLLDDVVLGFYYIGNPLLGKCIFKNEYVAIYERSNIPKPTHFPSGLKVSGDGIVFIGFQARAAFPCPLVVCNHRFKTPERERYDIYFGTILDVMMDMVDSMDGAACSYILEALEKHWYDYPDSQSDVDCWYSLIRKLIRRIAYYERTSEVMDDFISRHPDLVVCEQPTNIHMRNQKTQALTWRKLHLPESRLVQDSFSMFGYETLVKLCEEAGGYNVTRHADPEESELLNLLRRATRAIFDDFMGNYPPCLIIENDSAVVGGMAYMLKIRKKQCNSHGYKIRYVLGQIEIKKSLLAKEKFAGAFATYVHELCHCFGGDASAAFSLALTTAMAIVAANSESIQNYNREWQECF